MKSTRPNSDQTGINERGILKKQIKKVERLILNLENQRINTLLAQT